MGKNHTWVIQKNDRIYPIFILGALAPTIVGLLLGETPFNGPENIPSIFFVNIFPNVCGALIVCSLIDHISKLDEKRFISALTQTKKSLFDVIIRTGFFACYLNAVNYKADDSWKWANFANSCYLFFIISFGAVAVVIFFSRFVDNQPFPYTVREVFPTWTLFFSTLFLFSCGAAPLIAKIGKHEPLLLLFNTVTTCTIFGWLLWFIVRKTSQRSKEYPIIQLFFFLALDIANCLFNLANWHEPADIMSQVVSGSLILVITNIILFRLKHFRSENLNK